MLDLIKARRFAGRIWRVIAIRMDMEMSERKACTRSFTVKNMIATTPSAKTNSSDEAFI